MKKKKEIYYILTWNLSMSFFSTHKNDVEETTHTHAEVDDLTPGIVRKNILPFPIKFSLYIMVKFCKKKQRSCHHI